ncbi:MAG: Hsp20 family protein [Verrucomicrobiota bacterium]|nr:Hsp20 family protein [Verrucomicrobiota bacterium]
MKNTSINRRAGFLAVGLLTIGIALAAPFDATAVTTAEEKTVPDGFIQKMKKWEDEMSDKFRDTFKSLRKEDKEQSIATASVDLREQKDSYTVRLNLPNRDLDKLTIKLEGDTLSIVAPAENKAWRYEQVVALNGVAPDATPTIERKQKDNLIVVTVPKASIAVSQGTPSAIPDPALMPLRDWDRDLIARMDQMRREMDRIFDESFRDFRLMPEYKGFFDEPRFGSSLDVQEVGENYVVRAYLPERDMKDVNVTVEGQALRIEAKAEETEKKDDKGILKSHKAHYSQLVTLPGPVKADKMTVDRKEGMLVVTVPKA